MFNREYLNFFKKWYLGIDGVLLSIFFLFIILSCLFSFSFGTPIANRIGTKDYYFFKHQIVFALISLFLVFILSSMNENLARKSIFLFSIISFLLLILVPILGFRVKGAKRWIYMFGFSIQPTEFIKPALILLNSIFLEKIFETDNKKYLIFPLTLYVICSIFIIKQPDIGTLILLSTVFFAQIFLLDIIKIKYYICLFIGSVFVIFVLYKTLPHVSNRIDNFLSSIKNPDNANYQVRRSLLAYKNAGFLGKGFLDGYVKNHIPDVHTDFIFPAITEEFGFLISFLIITIYLYAFIRIVMIGYGKDNFFQFVALFGLSFLFISQTMINMCVSMNMLPTKGMTLPFLSYGGSSMLGMSILFGYVLVFTKNEFGIGKKLIIKTFSLFLQNPQ